MRDALPQRWARLSPLLDGLLDLDAAGRAARLSRQRDLDAALADELAALLASHDDAFLEGQAVAAPASLAGQRFGAYTLIEPIGAGGMGSVWRAQRSDGRYEGDVAVKLLNLALVAQGGAERFAREAQVLARLSHPNIAHLIDVGVGEGGQPFIVLEHVQGEPIDRHCETRRLDTRERVRLLLDVLAAVEHAHARLVLHRDLKPGNILVTAEGRIKLLDFGIAKLLGDSDGAAAPTALTQLAGRAFTPEYAAPEQVQGGEVTAATDVYALGVLMYLLLSGAHPTARPTDTPVDRLRSVVETEPPRLSAVAPARIAQHLPKQRARIAAALRKEQARIAAALRGDLDNIAAKALKKSPAERYASVAAFAEDLKRYLADEPVSARADSWRYRGAKFVRRHRLGVAAGTLMALALVGGAAGTAWQAQQARRERDQALHQAALAQARSNLLNLALNVTGGPDAPITLRQILDRSAVLVDQQFAADPRIAVELLVTLAGQYEHAGDAERDAALMARATQLAQASTDAGLVANVACNSVSTELALGRVDAARERLASGLAALGDGASATAGTRVACHRAGGELANAEGDPARAVGHIEAALGAQTDSRSPQRAVLLNFLAHLHAQTGDLARAEVLHRQLLAQDAALGRSDSRGDLRNRCGLASVLDARGQPREAQALLEAITARADGIASDGALPLWLEVTRAHVRARLGDVAGAEAQLRATAEHARSHSAQRSAWRADWERARVLLMLGRPDEAEVLSQAAQRGLGRDASRHFTPVMMAAAIRLAQGRFGEAVAAIEGELPRLLAGSAAEAEALHLASVAHLRAGDALRAQQRAQAAVAAAERLARDPVQSADVGRALLALAHAERAADTTTGGGAAATARRAQDSLRRSLGEAHALTQEALVLAPPP
jgi:eukaryotic-like serine/threonine-protein kinase